MKNRTSFKALKWLSTPIKSESFLQKDVSVSLSPPGATRKPFKELGSRQKRRRISGILEAVKETPELSKEVTDRLSLPVKHDTIDESLPLYTNLNLSTRAWEVLRKHQQNQVSHPHYSTLLQHMKNNVFPRDIRYGEDYISCPLSSMLEVTMQRLIEDSSTGIMEKIRSSNNTNLTGKHLDI